MEAQVLLPHKCRGNTGSFKKYYKDVLFKAGLGEKEIEFNNLDASPEEFREVILNAYPKLRDGGGYQFLKCPSNSRNLECLSLLTMSSPSKLKMQVGNSRTYIRLSKGI